MVLRTIASIALVVAITVPLSVSAASSSTVIPQQSVALQAQIMDRFADLLRAFQSFLSHQGETTTPQQVAAGGSSSFAGAGRIDNLSNTTIQNPTITGGSISGAAIIGTISNVLNSALATITDLIVTSITGTSATFTNATTTNLVATNVAFTNALPVSSGGTGNAATPTYGQLLIGNAFGRYSLVATSSLGIAVFPNIVHVSDYTNDTNCSQDDTSAINGAIAAAGAGGTVLFPANACLQISNTLTQLASQSWVGAGSQQNTNGTSAGGTQIDFTTSTGRAVVMVGDGASISHMSFYDSNSLSVSAVAIQMGSNSTNPISQKIDDVSIFGFSTQIDLQSGVFYRISNFTLENATQFGIRIRNVYAFDQGDGSIANGVIQNAIGTGVSALRVESGGGPKISNIKMLGFAYGTDVQVADGVATSDLFFENVSSEAQTSACARFGQLGPLNTGTWEYIIFHVQCAGNGVNLGPGISETKIGGIIAVTGAYGINVTGGRDITVEDGTIIRGATTAGVKVDAAVSDAMIGKFTCEGCAQYLQDSSSALGTVIAANVGIGTTTPSGILNTYSTTGGQVYFDSNQTGTAPGQLVLRGQSNLNQQLILGYNTTSDYGSIQAIKQGSAFKALVLNPSGGNVGIGTTSPTNKFEVAGDTFLGGNLTATGALSVIGNTTLANATTTTLFSTTASSTNIFAQTASLGALSAGTLSLSSTLNVSGLATFTNSFISQASSTVVGNFTSTGIGTFLSGSFTNTSGTTTIASGQGFTIGSSQFVLQQGSGNVGIGTTTPSGILNTYSTTGGQVYFDSNQTGTAPGQLVLRGQSNLNQQLILGYNTTSDYGSIQAIKQGSAFKALVLNPSGGNVGIGTSTPYSRLTVWGPDSAASTTAFLVANSASTTEFAVLDNGNATLAGNLIQNSDQRLKTNIQSFDASSAIAAIRALNPVSYSWIDPDKGSTPQYGFIAQDVQKVFPNLVNVTSPTPLTPDGTLSLNYNGFIAPLVAVVQTLMDRMNDFTDHFTTKQLTFTRATGDEVDANRICVNKSDGTPVCITGDQLEAVLNQANQQPEPPPSSAPKNSSDQSTTTVSDAPPLVPDADQTSSSTAFSSAAISTQ